MKELKQILFVFWKPRRAQEERYLPYLENPLDEAADFVVANNITNMLPEDAMLTLIGIRFCESSNLPDIEWNWRYWTLDKAHMRSVWEAVVAWISARDIRVQYTSRPEGLTQGLLVREVAWYAAKKTYEVWKEEKQKMEKANIIRTLVSRMGQEQNEQDEAWKAIYVMLIEAKRIDELLIIVGLAPAVRKSLFTQTTFKEYYKQAKKEWFFYSLIK